MKRQIFLILILLSLNIRLYANEDQNSTPKGLSGVSGITIEGLYYLSYQAGQKYSGAVLKDYNLFTIKRGYFTVKKHINEAISSRITLDTYQDDTGDFKVRLKYIYAEFKLPEIIPFLTKPYMELGLVHTPWLDFEEYLNYYRMQDTMFMERVGIFNSGDFGFTVLGYFGGEMDEEYQARVNKKYPGRWGSFAFGIYNGGGYHAEENNQNKVFEERISFRPFPDSDLLAGFQISELFISGKGNDDGLLNEQDDWQTGAIMLSCEHRHAVFTGQYVLGKGKQDGSAPDSAEYQGCSFFAEFKPGKHLRVIARYDLWDPDRDAKDDGDNRFITGAGYDFGDRNMLLLDYEVKGYQAAGKKAEPRFQVTYQVHF